VCRPWLLCSARSHLVSRGCSRISLCWLLLQRLATAAMLPLLHLSLSARAVGSRALHGSRSPCAQGLGRIPLPSGFDQCKELGTVGTARSALRLAVCHVDSATFRLRSALSLRWSWCVHRSRSQHTSRCVALVGRASDAGSTLGCITAPHAASTRPLQPLWRSSRVRPLQPALAQRNMSLLRRSPPLVALVG
jgi:hypothetical protein